VQRPGPASNQGPQAHDGRRGRSRCWAKHSAHQAASKRRSCEWGYFGMPTELCALGLSWAQLRWRGPNRSWWPRAGTAARPSTPAVFGAGAFGSRSPGEPFTASPDFCRLARPHTRFLDAYRSSSLLLLVVLSPRFKRSVPSTRHCRSLLSCRSPQTDPLPASSFPPVSRARAR
jgi:hypothetical protein